jgi:hypothetical protein
MHKLQTFCTFSLALVAVGNSISVKKCKMSRAAQERTDRGGLRTVLDVTGWKLVLLVSGPFGGSSSDMSYMSSSSSPISFKLNSSLL